jgi:hypothetical protein
MTRLDLRRIATSRSTAVCTVLICATLLSIAAVLSTDASDTVTIAASRAFEPASMLSAPAKSAATEPAAAVAARTCDNSRALHLLEKGRTMPDAIHVVVMAIDAELHLTGRAAFLRRLLEDIIERTPAVLVIHVFALLESPGLPVLTLELPRCDRVSYDLLNGTALLESALAKQLCRNYASGGGPACIYLAKSTLHTFMLDVDAVLVVDVDVRVLGDLRELLVTELAVMRAAGAIIGLGLELQPEYLEFGLGQGYNGGVQLLDLAAMRSSTTFASFLSRVPASRPSFEALTSLGDQTMYTFLNTTAEGQTGGAGGRPLIHTLPCGWNVNLCMFHQKQKPELRARFPWVHVGQCEAPAKLIHGNGALYSHQQMGNMDAETLLSLVARIRGTGRSNAPDALTWKDELQPYFC